MKRLFIILSLLFTASALAAPKDAEVERVRAALGQLIPDQAPDAISAAPFAGFYEVTFGAQVLYVSADGRYLLSGEVIDLKSRSNLTEQRRGKARLAALEALGEESMIIFSPKGEVKHTVTVFTDIDCTYCRKLHEGMEEMNRLGIRVRYLAYPRAGIGAPSYRKAVSVWCAKDRQEAMSVAKAGGAVKESTCQAPVQRHMELAEDFGIRGTPALVLEDGRVLPGYLPPARLLTVLEEG